MVNGKIKSEEGFLATFTLRFSDYTHLQNRSFVVFGTVVIFILHYGPGSVANGEIRSTYKSKWIKLEWGTVDYWGATG